MSKTETLNILVGAGFSFNAGLPLGNDVKAKFDRPLRDTIIKAGSSEWMWVEGQSEAMVHNGRLGGDHLEYAFILEEIVRAYKLANGNNFNDYEDFYQYVKDNTPIEGWYERIIVTASQRFYSETHLTDRSSEYYGFAFRNPERYRPQEIINYLIADMLGIKVSEEELIINYEPFIRYIRQYKFVNIFSLNHDRVFEFLFKLFGIDFNDGFSATNSNLQHEKKSLPIFQNEFEATNVRLIKMHGSIDMYLFEHGDEIGATMTRNGGYTYFKPGSYHAKHYAIRIDPATNQTVQSINFDIIPKFITGKKKKAFIGADYMYSKMYKMYQEQISSGNDLLIAGYSFRDAHMNEELLKFTKTEGAKIVNLNHGDKYPFVAPSITEINQFTELK